MFGSATICPKCGDAHLSCCMGSLCSSCEAAEYTERKIIEKETESKLQELASILNINLDE